jgi:hypothetical protein
MLAKEALFKGIVSKMTTPRFDAILIALPPSVAAL